MKLFKLVNFTNINPQYQPKLMFVSAACEREARETATDYDKQSYHAVDHTIWLDPECVLCEEIKLDESEVICAI